MGNLRKSYGVQPTPQELELSDLGFELLILCKLAGCTLNVQPANLHNIFSRFLQARHIDHQKHLVFTFSIKALSF